MAMTNQDLDEIQEANENKNVMFSIMKDAYNKRNKKKAGAKKMGMGGTCPPKVIQGKSLR